MLNAPRMHPVQGAGDGQGKFPTVDSPASGGAADLGLQGAAHRLAHRGGVNAKVAFGPGLHEHIPQVGGLLDVQTYGTVDAAVGQVVDGTAERRDVQVLAAVAAHSHDILLAQMQGAGQVHRKGGVAAAVVEQPPPVAEHGGVVGDGSEGEQDGAACPLGRGKELPAVAAQALVVVLVAIVVGQGLDRVRDAHRLQLQSGAFRAHQRGVEGGAKQPAVVPVVVFHSRVSVHSKVTLLLIVAQSYERKKHLPPFLHTFWAAEGEERCPKQQMLPRNGGAYCSADEVRHGAGRVLRVVEPGSLAGLDAVQQPGHVAAQLLHHSAALGVLQHLLGIGAVHHGPVGAVDQRHVEELRVLDQLVQRGGGAGAAGRAADGGGLVGQIFAACIGQPVHEAGHVAGSRGVVHRAAKHEAVGGLCLFNGLVDHAAKHAAIALGTAAAADAAAHGFAADMQDLSVHTGIIQFLCNERKGGIGAAFFVRAAVDEQNFHGNTLLLCQNAPQKPGAAGFIVAQTARRRNARPLTRICSWVIIK